MARLCTTPRVFFLVSLCLTVHEHRWHPGVTAEPWEKVLSGSTCVSFQSASPLQAWESSMHLSKPGGGEGVSSLVLAVLRELDRCLVAPGNCAVASAAALLLKQWPRKVPFYELVF